MSDTLPVLIIGAGLGGLTLAQGLQKHNIPYRIFERDVNTTRSQGYRIRIHGDGPPALQYCLPDSLWARFVDTSGINDLGPKGMGKGRIEATTGESLEAKEGGFMAIMRKAAEAAAPGGQAGPPGPSGPPGPPGPPGPRPGDVAFQSYAADRKVMRDVLASDLITPSYGKAFTHHTTESTGVTAHFEDGSSAQGSLIVGADGVNSRIARSLIGGASAPIDTGSRLLYGKTPLSQIQLDSLLPDMQQGISVVVDNTPGHRVLLFMEIMRFKHASAPPDYIYWVLCYDKELAPVEYSNPVLVMESLTSDWHPQITTILENATTSDMAITRVTIAHLHGIPKWETQPGVTIIGDAVHPVPPTATGANTALHDAQTLLRHLINGKRDERGQWPRETIRGYEDEMRGYADDMVKKSYQTAVGFLGIKPIQGV